MEIHKGFSFPIPEITEEEEKEIIAREKELENQECLDNFYRCGIGKEYRKYDLHSFETKLKKQSDMLESARTYYGHIIHGRKSNMIVTGSAGEGKTHLVVGLLKQFCFTKKVVKFNNFEVSGFYSVYYITSKDLCDLFRKTQAFNTDYSTYSFYRDFARTFDVLAIDELGKATDKNEWQMIFDILDKRNQEGKSTIVVSNLSYDELNKNLGDYGMSRLNVNGNLVKVDSTGIPDKRQGE